jgi:hypothetical protein
MSAILLGLYRLRELAAAFALIVLLAPVAVAQEASGVAGTVPSIAAAPAPSTEATPVPAAAPVVEEKLSDAQLEQLAAPIALHPDSLLAQIMTASTYPLEVEMAARWSKANPKLKGKELENAMQRQNWDPSVKSLTAVPQVLLMMSDKLDWTRQLGDAYLAQPDDLTRAIQRLRSKAADAGHLKTTKHQKVTRVSGPPPDVVGLAPEPEYIAIEPVEPEIIFVPVYDPLVVYGPWPWPVYSPFFWYPPGYVTVGVFGFGAPCFVGPALWARYDWRARRIGIHMPYYNAFNRTRFANVGIHQTWRHNPVHRGNIAYRDAALQQRFGRPGGIDRQGINRSGVNGGVRPFASRTGLPQNGPGQNGPGLQRQGLTGNIDRPNGVPRANLNGNTNPALRQNGIGPRNAAISPNVNVNRGSVNINRGPAVHRNNLGANPGTTVNRNVTIHRNNVNIHRNTNVHRNVAVPRTMNGGTGVPRVMGGHAGMPRTMGGHAGTPRAMGGGMPAARPMMGSSAGRAAAAPAARGPGGVGIRR